MGLKNKRNEKRLGPFRGPTPPKVFQTVDVGSRHGEYLLTKAPAFPSRQYVAVDPEYKASARKNALRSVSESEWRTWNETGVEPFDPVKARNQLQAAGVLVVRGSIQGFIKKMKKTGLKTRYLNIDQPNRNLVDYSYKELFHWAPRFLLPNGKIFVTSEDTYLLKQIETLARDAGLKIRYRKPIPEPGLRTEYMKGRKDIGPMIQLEITFGLKKAFPNKNQRRSWPKT